MKYLAACLLLKLAGTDPSESKVKDILSSAGVSYDAELCKNVISKIKGANIDELMEKGRMKMSCVGAAPAGSAPVASQAATETKAEKEKEKEPEPESDEDMGFSLFD